MCGILRYFNKHNKIISFDFKSNVDKLNNRGPDSSAVVEIDNVLLGLLISN